MQSIKYLIYFIVSMILSLASAQAQNLKVKKNSIYGELLGNAGLYSINYDRVFQLSNGLKLVPRIGFSTVEKVKIVPIEINILLSKSNTSKNFFETGLGLTILKPSNEFSDQLLTLNGYDYNLDNKLITSPLIIRGGFRHQKPNGGFMYRTGLILFASKESLITLGIALGYTF